MKTNPENPAVYRVDQVARRLKCSKQHVINLIEAGQLGAINIGTSSAQFYRVPVKAVELFQQRRDTLGGEAAK